MAVIDAHHHFWRTAAQEQPWRQSSHTALERDFEPADLVAELDASGIDATVLMQSVDEPAENTRLREYARDERVAGVVGWLPIRDACAARDQLEALEMPKLRGVRCLIGSDPLEWLGTPPSVGLFRELAVRGLAWDVVPITFEQTRAVLQLARAVPDLRIIIDHLGRPPVESAGWEPWASHQSELAGCDNVAVKVSVGIDALTAWQRWDAAALAPYVEHVVASFGPDRMMLASNWPVIELRAAYGQAWKDLRALIEQAGVRGTGLEAAVGGTAARWYRLN